MDYNTSRPHMQIPEYGRNVHNMVAHCMSIEDRDKRNKVANSIIDVIGNLNPHLRDTPDFKHKLWDHLFIMSDFQLDVDSPYPIPQKESFQDGPELLDYPVKSAKFRHYGNILKEMIKTAISLPEGEYKEGLVQSILNQMKKSYLTWNKDTVEDEVLLKELKILSQGKLSPSLDSIEFWKVGNITHQKSNKRGHKKGHNKNQKNKRKFYKK